MAVAVSTQTTSSSFPRRPTIKRGDAATVNAQALAAIGATMNRQRPTVRDLMALEQPPPERDLRRPRIDKLEILGQKSTSPDMQELDTIPYWSDSFTYQKLTYKYTMVGTDPKRGSATTTIPTVLIPLRFVFEDGTVIDASSDLIDGQTAIQGIINSPIFQPHDFNVGGISVGNTQYGDAFQRANFWNFVSRQAPDYHVLLGQPTVAPAFEVFVEDGEIISFATDPETGALIPIIDSTVLENATFDALNQANISLQTLPIVVWGNIFGEYSGTGVPEDFNGFHWTIPEINQTFISVPYHPRHMEGREDVYYLSREILNWLNDPFISSFLSRLTAPSKNSFTPGWNFPGVTYPLCLSGFNASAFLTMNEDRLEVADVLDMFLESHVTINSDSTTYHLADGAFLDYFTRASPSSSANGQYTFFGFTNSPSAVCIGHVEKETSYFVEHPDRTTNLSPRDINNNGWVAGVMQRFPSSRQHGFLYDGRTFTQLDYPGAVRTFPLGLNDAGQVAGYYVNTAGYPHGFSYFDGNFTPIDFPGSTDTIARGINSRGEIVGLYDATQEITHGFIFQNGQYLT